MVRVDVPSPAGISALGGAGWWCILYTYSSGMLLAQAGNHRGRKMTKHSFPAIEMCFRMCSAAFPQVQHSPPFDYKYMYTIQCGGNGVRWVVLENIYFSTYALCVCTVIIM